MHVQQNGRESEFVRNLEEVVHVQLEREQMAVLVLAQGHSVGPHDLRNALLNQSLNEQVVHVRDYCRNQILDRFEREKL